METNLDMSNWWRAENVEKRTRDHEMLAEAKEWQRRNVKNLESRTLPDGTVIIATSKRIKQLEKEIMKR